MKLSDHAGTRLSSSRRPHDLDMGRRYREQVLASARVLLSAAGLVAVFIDPSEPEHFAGLAYGLLAAFVVYSGLVLVLLRRVEHRRVDRLSQWLHLGDVVWAGAISLFTSGPNSPFFVFFVFVILAAAFRWRMRESMETTTLLVAVLLGQAWLLGVDRGGFWLVGTLDINRLIMRAVYLLIAGFLAGFLADKGKQSALENAHIHDVTAHVRASLSFRQAVTTVLERLLDIFHAHRGVIVLDDTRRERAFVLQLVADNAGQDAVKRDPETAWREISHAEAGHYFFALPGSSVQLPGPSSRAATVVLDEFGRHVPVAFDAQLPPGILADSTHAALSRDLPGSDEWRARVILEVDGQWRVAAERSLHFLQRITESAAPVVYNAYLINQVRTRAKALERARVAREIHDSSLQSLSAIELQMQALEVKAVMVPDVAAEVERIRGLLREEIAGLRDLMHRVRPLDVSARNLPTSIADLGERFQRDTGVMVDFMTDGAAIDLPAPACREIYRMIQEALTNVRKHSGASNVVIRLEKPRDSWVVTIEDDGKGFGFTGELSHEQLTAADKGPRVIRERAAALGGTLAVVSSREGSQLRIQVPPSSLLQYV